MIIFKKGVSMKKVVFVNSSLSGGGSERVMTLLANQMAEDGYDIIMLLCVHNEEVYKLNEKVKSFYLKENNSNGLNMRLTRLKELRSKIKEEKPDVVISFMSQINMYSLIATIGLNAKVIVSERADPKQRSKVHRIVESILYTIFADNVVFQTEFVKKYFNLFIQKKSEVIANPIDVSILPVYKGKKEKHIAGIGRLTSQKNFELLINAFSEFDKKVSGYTLHIFGDGPLLNRLKKLVDEKQLTQKVIFHGYVKNIAEQICKYNMYVSTSNFEGISNAMLESMAMGIPTICTDCPVGGARMMIKNGVNGLLIPMNDQAALVDAMLRIADDKNVAQNISDAAIQIGKELDLKKIANKWEKLVEGGSYRE